MEIEHEVGDLTLGDAASETTISANGFPSLTRSIDFLHPDSARAANNISPKTSFPVAERGTRFVIDVFAFKSPRDVSPVRRESPASARGCHHGAAT